MENEVMIPLSPKEGVALLNLVLEEEEFGAGLSEELSRVKRRLKALAEEAGARKGTGYYYLLKEEKEEEMTGKRLEEMVHLGRAVALYAEDLSRLHRERPGRLDEERIRKITEAMRRIVSELYALGAKVRAEGEDNSAEALRREFSL